MTEKAWVAHLRDVCPFLSLSIDSRHIACRGMSFFMFREYPFPKYIEEELK
ncbi:hypothetical protein JCM21738_2899 [Mesobacillus boroniphilus JCM 21738]|uniref:Uncharacterized protein n=1 Tax=Mesobacillus boroniphilus JCM 21738 TaxID=1294265 RepID=W4RNN8_9BACI|nr:hypothetical protein JCM21738_2899 [Mesobacillus boroniphilus JCM 21738]